MEPCLYSVSQTCKGQESPGRNSAQDPNGILSDPNQDPDKILRKILYDPIGSCLGSYRIR